LNFFLLDTDTCSYIIQDYSENLRARFQAVAEHERAISAITYAEILIGLRRKRLGQRRLRVIGAFLRNIEVLPWTADAASWYADLTNQLRANPIGEHDTMIAAHAIALDATLVTNNSKHFSRIGPRLKMENWI
jgi:tRNA(fMet)-specific endonuclease VapC